MLIDRMFAFPLTLDALSMSLFCIRVNQALAHSLKILDHKDTYIYSIQESALTLAVSWLNAYSIRV
jgi:hypothetical protein